jgi:hypothetical protein
MRGLVPHIRRAVLACAAGLLGVPLAAPAHATPVTGYVTIVWFAPDTAPSVATGGALATWSCVQTVWPTLGPFTVTCTPPPLSGPWECDGLVAAARTHSPGGRARTTLRCDGAIAAQTVTVSGTGQAHTSWPARGLRANTSLSCTVDDGGVPLMAVPDFSAFCGDARSLG